jgi:hypothetical protein
VKEYRRGREGRKGEEGRTEVWKEGKRKEVRKYGRMEGKRKE